MGLGLGWIRDGFIWIERESCEMRWDGLRSLDEYENMDICIITQS